VLREQIAVTMHGKALERYVRDVGAWVHEARCRGGGDATAVAALLAAAEGKVVLGATRDDATEARFYGALLEALAAAGEAECAAAARAGVGAAPAAALDVYSTVCYMRHRFLPPATRGTGGVALQLPADAPPWLRDMPGQLCDALRRGAPPFAPVADVLAAELASAHPPPRVLPGMAEAALAAQLELAGPRLTRVADAVHDGRVDFVPDRWQARRCRCCYFRKCLRCHAMLPVCLKPAGAACALAPARYSEATLAAFACEQLR
jgi:hypothetical protein